MTVRLELQHVESMRETLRMMASDVRREVDDELGGVAADLETAIKLKIQQGPNTGLFYRRGNISHQASAPGEAPASDTGALMGSYYHEREKELVWNVGSRSATAVYLEYRTVTIEARPHVRPAVAEMRKAFDMRVSDAIKRAVR